MRFKVAILLAVLLLVGSAVSFAQINRTDSDFVGVAAPPIDADGGDACPPGVSITGPLPFMDTGDTCNFTDTVGAYPGGSCGVDLPFAYAGEDTIYEVEIGAGNNVGFEADLTGSNGDLALFLLGTCGDGNSCVSHSQDAIGPGAGPELIDPQAYTPGTYFLYVDSYYAAGTPGSCGTYSLSVTGTLPVELIEFSVE